MTDAIMQDLARTLRGFTRMPTRLELVATVVLWFVLATGHVARGPRIIYVDAQVDSQAWVQAQGGTR